MRDTNRWTIAELIGYTNENQTEIEPGKWGPVRPYGWPSFKFKLKCVWGVFIGKYDVIVWPEDEIKQEERKS